MRGLSMKSTRLHSVKTQPLCKCLVISLLNYSLTPIGSSALGDPANYIQPVVDWLAEQYGWTVTLLMAGPMPGEEEHKPMRMIRFVYFLSCSISL